MNAKLAATIASGSLLAAGSGYLASTALSQESAPTRTVTIEVGQPGPTGPQGETGPAGPAGPPGPVGGQTCSAGFSHSVVVFNSPGGQQTIETCLKD